MPSALKHLSFLPSRLTSWFSPHFFYFFFWNYNYIIPIFLSSPQPFPCSPLFCFKFMASNSCFKFMCAVTYIYVYKYLNTTCSDHIVLLVMYVFKAVVLDNQLMYSSLGKTSFPENSKTKKMSLSLVFHNPDKNLSVASKRNKMWACQHKWEFLSNWTYFVNSDTITYITNIIYKCFLCKVEIHIHYNFFQLLWVSCHVIQTLDYK